MSNQSKLYQEREKIKQLPQKSSLLWYILTLFLGNNRLKSLALSDRYKAELPKWFWLLLKQSIPVTLNKKKRTTSDFNIMPTVCRDFYVRSSRIWSCSSAKLVWRRTEQFRADSGEMDLSQVGIMLIPRKANILMLSVTFQQQQCPFRQSVSLKRTCWYNWKEEFDKKYSDPRMFYDYDYPELNQVMFPSTFVINKICVYCKHSNSYC